MCVVGDLTSQINYWRDRGELMPEDFVLSILRQICEGLKIVHASGIIHLDLKPENIFLRKDGSIKIGDFGCSKIFHKS